MRVPIMLPTRFALALEKAWSAYGSTNIGGVPGPSVP